MCDDDHVDEAGIEIRDATEADLHRITEIFNQAIPRGDAEWTEQLHTVDERRRWWRDRISAGRPVLVAVGSRDAADADVLGVASYGDFRDSTCREGFRFTVEHSVYVDDAARGSGVADALMDELESRARADGKRVIVATIDALNGRSIRFHERRGYVEVGRMPNIGFTFDTWRTMVLLQLEL